MSTEHLNTPLTTVDEKHPPSISDFDPTGAIVDGSSAEVSAEAGATEQASPLSAVEKQTENPETLTAESSSSDGHTSPALTDSEDNSGVEVHEEALLNFRPRGRGDKPVVGKPVKPRPRPR